MPSFKAGLPMQPVRKNIEFKQTANLCVCRDGDVFLGNQGRQGMWVPALLRELSPSHPTPGLGACQILLCAMHTLLILFLSPTSSHLRVKETEKRRDSLSPEPSSEAKGDQTV